MTATMTMTCRIATGTAVAALSLGMVACSDSQDSQDSQDAASGTGAAGRDARGNPAEVQTDDVTVER